MAITDFLADSVTESVFNLKLWWSPSLVKFQTFIMNSNDKVCDGASF